jgi:hypothetical protein
MNKQSPEELMGRVLRQTAYVIGIVSVCVGPLYVLYSIDHVKFAWALEGIEAAMAMFVLGCAVAGRITAMGLVKAFEKMGSKNAQRFVSKVCTLHSWTPFSPLD